MENNQVLARDVFGRGEFKSYSEFYLALAMSKVLYEKGMSLNMDGMLVDIDVIPKDMVDYYKKLVFIGAVRLSMSPKVSAPIDEIKCDIDTSYFDSVPLVYSNGDKLEWDFEYAKDNYGEYSKKFLDLIPLGNTLMHLVAYYVVSRIIDGETRGLVIHLDKQKARSTFIYASIYSCLQTLDFLRDCVELDVDFGEYKVDLDYSVHCSNGRVAGRHKLFPLDKKLELLGKYGMVEGAILSMWEREGMCENNPYGRITGAKLFRLNEIGDNFLGVTFIAVNRTKEEVYQDYLGMDSRAQNLFVDMLDKKPYMQSTEIDICGVGIDNYFLNEDKFITLLDGSEKVYKLITVEGKQANVEMSGVDAIYWLLCQYEIEFDRELYRSMYYSEGVVPLWDMYN